MAVIQFESPVENNVIRIPEQYIDRIPDRVTIMFDDAEKNQLKPKERQLGTLQDRGSVTFKNDFYMTTEEFANL